MADILTSSVLVRAWEDETATGMRAAAADGVDHMVGHFAVFDRWTEINSRVEGHFMERLGSRSFDRTLAARRKQIRVLLEHGKDPQVGNKPLGDPVEIQPEPFGVRYDVALFNAGYVNDIKPAIGSGQMGASFRFRQNEVERVYPKKASDYNPQMLEERTILDLDCFEFGPTTFGAYPDATSGLRSMTDWFVDDLLTDRAFIARFADRIGAANLEQLLSSLPVAGRKDEQTPEDRSAAGESVTQLDRRRLVEAHYRLNPLKGV